MPIGINPAWANLPRIRCDNCPNIFRPKRPHRPGQHRFCCGNCRKEFSKRGGSFSKLKPVIIQEVRRLVKDQHPLDAAWQRKIEQRLADIEAFVDYTVNYMAAFDPPKRSA